MSQKFEPIEELSCSYVSAKKYNECIISSTKYPSISEDSSDYSGSPNSEKFVLSNDNSATGAVLKRRNVKKYVSPLSAFFKGNQEKIKNQQQRYLFLKDCHFQNKYLKNSYFIILFIIKFKKKALKTLLCFINVNKLILNV
jgi:hypothetical protein